jgi:hypothetical protein
MKKNLFILFFVLFGINAFAFLPGNNVASKIIDFSKDFIILKDSSVIYPTEIVSQNNSIFYVLERQSIKRKLNFNEILGYQVSNLYSVIGDLGFKKESFLISQTGNINLFFTFKHNYKNNIYPYYRIQKLNGPVLPLTKSNLSDMMHNNLSFLNRSKVIQQKKFSSIKGTGFGLFLLLLTLYFSIYGIYSLIYPDSGETVFESLGYLIIGILAGYFGARLTSKYSKFLFTDNSYTEDNIIRDYNNYKSSQKQ